LVTPSIESFPSTGNPLRNRGTLSVTATVQTSCSSDVLSSIRLRGCSLASLRTSSKRSPTAFCCY
jgi:hypothetical protein